MSGAYQVLHCHVTTRYEVLPERCWQQYTETHTRGGARLAESYRPHNRTCIDSQSLGYIALFYIYMDSILMSFFSMNKIVVEVLTDTKHNDATLPCPVFVKPFGQVFAKQALWRHWRTFSA